MRSFRMKFFLSVGVIALTMLACDGSTFVAVLSGTPTPTTKPRPTFTPRPAETPTPEDTPTPEPTLVLTPTRRAATVRPPTAKPTSPPAPTVITRPVQLEQYYACPQSSESSVYEIVGRVQRGNPRVFAGDAVFELRSPDGSFRKTTLSLPDEAAIEQIFGSTDCKSGNRWRYNLKLDAAEIRGHGGYIARIIKSTTDSTPLSPDATVDFNQTVRWVFYFVLP